MIDNYIMVDVDSKDITLEDLRERFYRVCQLLWPPAVPGEVGLRKYRLNIFESPSGRGYHLVGHVFLSHRASRHRILLAQCLCWSDPDREFANLRRIVDHVPDWNILFSILRERLVDK